MTSSFKVLIADDEPNILMLTEMLFKDMGHEVVKAVDGAEALRKIKSEHPDLIITDVIMPHKTGYEVCKAVREDPEIDHIPIIILSALGEEFNKITGFEEGADDYITKPFSVEELRARANVLLLRAKRRSHAGQSDEPEPPSLSKQDEKTLNTEFMSTGIPELDKNLNGGLPKGSNILIIGKIGSGKSSFARRFLTQGLSEKERCLFVALDDNPTQIRAQLEKRLAPTSLASLEEASIIHFVDAYSWSTIAGAENERFAVSGMLDLNSLSGIISDAGQELGQSVQSKLGGRRVIDSLSSLLVDFELPSVVRFIKQIARTAVSFGGVTTLFLLEDGTVDDKVLNNIKVVMDGVLEFDRKDGKKAARVSSMKWSSYSSDWVYY